MRGRVIPAVRGRLRASGVSLDDGDLDACYAQAWQGLYTALLEGQDIANPAGWLVLVTFRRAIEEHRTRLRVERVSDPGVSGARVADERDIAAELDDRTKLRALFEGLRGRLNDREREAAVLCYLQGLSRQEAAARMGVSDTRMRKLMEGRGPGRPGVAGKVGALVDTIRAGGWCEEQGSLMRGFAYGLLDPDGERHRLALMHCEECPACRSYVASLRGLAAALPPVLLPWGVGAGLLAGARELGRSGATAAAPGAAAAGAGGGWMLTGGAVTAKLAAGCLLTLTIGAGCIALGQGSAHPPARRQAPHREAALSRVRPAAAAIPVAQRAYRASARAVRPQAASHITALAPAARAAREFGLEAAPAPTARDSAAPARTAAARPAPSPAPAASPAAVAAAAREFSPG